jgi:hypothetical protein
LKQPPILTNTEIRDALSRARRKRVGVVEAALMNPDEQGHTLVPWPAETLPDIDGGWMLQASVAFVHAAAKHFKRDAVASSAGPDDLFVSLFADTASASDALIGAAKEPQRGRIQRPDIDDRESFVVKGRVVVVGSPVRPMLAHVSTVGTILLNFVDIVPADADRSKHYRTDDGCRIAGLFVHWYERSLAGGRGQDIPALVLRYLAEREQPQDAGSGGITVLPSASAYMLPNIPTIGERSRIRRGKSSPMPKVEDIVDTLNARKVSVGVRIELDDDSMRLAASSFDKRPGKGKKRSQALQLRIPFGSKEARTTEEVQAAVQAALAHFDTDYLISFDAVAAILAATPNGIGTALDETLRRKVVEMRYGSTISASKAQRERVALHFDTLCRVVVRVVPTGKASKSRVFQGRIIIPTGEVVDEADQERPLKVGDVVMLNPDLYREIAQGKGLFLDSRYFRFDPYRQDWEMRVYRYLADRWSMSSVGLQSRDDWTLRLKLPDMLDMAGVDWRTPTQRTQHSRSVAEQRRRVESVLATLQRDGFVGPWRIDGRDLDAKTMLSVEVAPGLRDEIVGRRKGLHQRAARGALQPRKVKSRKD